MPLKIALPRERREGERRVALVPAAVQRLLASWPTLTVQAEVECGHAAGFPDGDYEGVEFFDDFLATVDGADIVVKVGTPTLAEIEALAPGTVLVTLTRAFQHLPEVEALATRGITTIGMDMMPRTARARSMDAVSSQATVAGYKAALLAAELSPRLFPMMTTAAGTIRPSRVVVIGAGAAGLQAIATARRLGAVVEAYDIRSLARERIESLGARMIDTGVEATDSAGHARALRRDEQKHQQEVLAEHLSRAHTVICAASIPGRPAPRIVTTDMVDGMLPDTVIVDMAASTGGNCELTRPGEHVQHGDTLIVGPLNLPSHGAVHASEMYARNVTNLLALIIDVEGSVVLDEQDEIIARCVLTHDGDVCHPMTAALLERTARAFGTARQANVDDGLDNVSDWADEAPDDETGGDADATGASRSAASSKGASFETERRAPPARDPGHAPARSGSTVAAPVAPVDRAVDNDSTDTPGSVGDALPLEGGTSGAVSKPAGSNVDGAADARSEDEQEATDAAQVEDRSTRLPAQEVDSAIALEEPQRDDLTAIAGIGPALQGRLYAFGIERLSALAELDAKARERLAVQLELDDEIERDDWCGQARQLLGIASGSDQTVEGTD